jgi:hypothetical protein
MRRELTDEAERDGQQHNGTVGGDAAAFVAVTLWRSTAGNSNDRVIWSDMVWLNVLTPAASYLASLSMTRAQRALCFVSSKIPTGRLICPVLPLSSVENSSTSLRA